MTNGTPARRSAEEIRGWIVDKLREHTHVDPNDVSLDEPLIAHGIDSMQFVVLVGELEEWLGCRFADNPLIDYPTINALSDFLARQLEAGKTVIDPASDG